MNNVAGDIFFNLSMDGTIVINTLNTMEQKTKETVKSMDTELKKLSDYTGSLGKSMTSSITEPLLEVGKSSLESAIQIEEATKKVNKVFDKSSGVITTWAKDSAQNMGMASDSAMELAINFGELGNSIDVASGRNAMMSSNLAQLSVDMASFYGIRQEVAAEALTGIFTGETEALNHMEFQCQMQILHSLQWVRV